MAREAVTTNFAKPTGLEISNIGVCLGKPTSRRILIHTIGRRVFENARGKRF